jgi:FKBP-type peptidyl-prolyl cis-trans isomerase SlyD
MEDARIQVDHMVDIHYRLRDEDGTLLDASEADAPLSYLHGHEQIFPGVEQALEGRTAGEVASITLSPEDGFGSHDPERIVTVPRGQFDFEVKIGTVVQAMLPDGRSHHLQVIESSDDKVTLDGNHPLAGKTVSFEVTVVSVRPATSDELVEADGAQDDEVS